MSCVTQIESFDQFEELILDETSVKQYAIIDFYGDNCPPCTTFEPVFAELAEKYKDSVHFLKANFRKVSELAIEYNVTKVPTFIFFKVGSADPLEEYTVVGIAKTESHIQTVLDTLLGKLTVNITDDF
jgi:thiol-disulfide isomerase/thioredoxin